MVPNEENLRNSILDLSYSKFAGHGFKKVTIDEIAAGLGISKKTVYKYFSSKEEILREVVLRRMAGILELFEKIQKMRDSSIIKIEAISRVVSTHINEEWQKILIETRINAPALFREVEEIIQTKLALGWQKIFVEGQKGGWIRKDIDPVVFTTSYVGVVRELMKSDFLSKHSITESEVPGQVFKMFTEGILTEKGRRR